MLCFILNVLIILNVVAGLQDGPQWFPTPGTHTYSSFSYCIEVICITNRIAWKYSVWLWRLDHKRHCDLWFPSITLCHSFWGKPAVILCGHLSNTKKWSTWQQEEAFCSWPVRNLRSPANSHASEPS